LAQFRNGEVGKGGRTEEEAVGPQHIRNTSGRGAAR
jgi:hypothetical protein